MSSLQMDDVDPNDQMESDFSILFYKFLHAMILQRGSSSRPSRHSLQQ